MEEGKPVTAVARMGWGRLAIAIAVSLLFLSACGGSDEESTPVFSDGRTATTTAPTAVAGGDRIDVCALLTAADLETATGLEWHDGTFNESLSSDQQWICDWATTEGGGFATAQVLVQTGDDSFESNRDSAEDVFGLVDPPVIAGADETYATVEGGILAMRIHGRFVQVSYIPLTAESVLEETAQLAQAVADRM